LGSPDTTNEEGRRRATSTRPRVWLRLTEEILSAQSGSRPPFSAWIYLGADAERYFRLRRALGGNGREIESGPLLNQAVDAFREELLNFDRVLEVRSELRWHATDTAERSVYTSELFHRCASSLVLADLVGDLDESLLVVTDDFFLNQRLAGLVRSLACGGDGRHRWSVERLRYVGYRIRQLCLGLAHRVYFVGAFAISRRRVRAAVPVRPTTQLDFLLVTWVDPGTFDSARLIEREVYFGALPGALRERGLRVGFVAVPASWMFPIDAILANVAGAKDSVLMLEQSLRWRDVISIVVCSLVSPVHVRRRLEVGTIDVTGHLVDELRSEAAKPRQLWAMQFFHLGRHIARQGPPAVVLHLFEGQPWEKMLRMGIQQGSSQTRVVGCQHTPMSVRWFPWSPSRRDLTSGQLPDHVLTLGPLWSRLLASYSYPPERIRVGQALRYAADEPSELRERVPRGDWSPTILVAGAMGTNETLELVVKAVRAVRQLDGVRLVVKLHPKMVGGRKLFLAALGRVLGPELPAEALEFADGSAADALADADVVLYTTTTVSYEALAAGLPVICVHSDFWFDLDPIPADAGVAVAARTPDELKQAIESLLNAGPATIDQQERRRQFLRDALAAGDPASFVSLVEEGPCRSCTRDSRDAG
jgi:glycosyltransferase involved in cell wall biosynthesis